MRRLDKNNDFARTGSAKIMISHAAPTWQKHRFRTCPLDKINCVARADSTKLAAAHAPTRQFLMQIALQGPYWEIRGQKTPPGTRCKSNFFNEIANIEAIHFSKRSPVRMGSHLLSYFPKENRFASPAWRPTPPGTRCEAMFFKKIIKIWTVHFLKR